MTITRKPDVVHGALIWTIPPILTFPYGDTGVRSLKIHPEPSPAIIVNGWVYVTYVITGVYPINLIGLLILFLQTWVWVKNLVAW
jgi:hypothetical protein